jgi:hypothetical protein
VWPTPPWLIEKLRALRLTKAAELAEAAVEETLTYYAPFPKSTGGAGSDGVDAPSDGIDVRTLVAGTWLRYSGTGARWGR